MIELYPWQQDTWQHILARVRQQRLPHALLLTGVAGLGKTSLAGKLAESLLCLAPDTDFHACGRCHSCQLMLAGSHPDHLYIHAEEAGKAIKIEQIRALKEKQSLTPSIAAWKTVIIESADAMTHSAANSLLKLLEEPPGNTILILTTDAVHYLPVTIRSRCQQMQLTAPDTQSTLQWLKQQQIEADVAQLQKLASFTFNAPLTIANALTTGEWQHYQQVQQDFEQLLKQSPNPVQLAAEWQQYDLIKVMHQLLFSVKSRLKHSLCEEMGREQPQQYWQIVDCIINTIKLLSSSNNYNKTLLIEDFLVSVMHISQTDPRLSAAPAKNN